MIVLAGIFFSMLFVIGLLLAVVVRFQDRHEWRKVIKMNKATQILVILDFVLALVLLFILAGVL